MSELVPTPFITEDQLHTKLMALETKLVRLVQQETIARERDTTAIRSEMTSGFKGLQAAFSELASLITGESRMNNELLITIRAKLDGMIETSAIRAEQVVSLSSDVARLKENYVNLATSQAAQSEAFLSRLQDAINPLAAKFHELAVSFAELRVGLKTERDIQAGQRALIFTAIKPLLTPRAIALASGIVLGVLSIAPRLIESLQILLN